MSTPTRPLGARKTTNNKPAPWALNQNSDRFAGPGSIYKPAAGTGIERSSPAPTKMPGKATPGSRNARTPSGAGRPTPNMASKTDRFAMPGGVYKQSDSPAPSAYVPQPLKPSGPTVSLVQKMHRRRQSRGIWADAVAKANGVGPTYYNPSALAKASVQTEVSAQYKDGRGRFETHDSMYAAPATPAIGQYETAVHIGSSKSSTVSYARAQPGRFEAHDTIYAKPATPGIGEYDITAHEVAAARPMSTKPHTTSFNSATDRFAAHDGVYKKSDTPGVSAYAPKKLNEGQAAIIMQKIHRRRQSRGLWAGAVAEAKEPTYYNPSAVAKATAQTDAPSAAYKDGRGRFETHDSVYAAPATPAIGQYETAAPPLLKKSSTVSYAAAKEGRFEGRGTIYAKPATPGIGEYDTAVHMASAKSSTVSYAKAKEGRFEGRGTIYAKPATPGIGEYDTAVPFNIDSSKSCTISYAKEPRRQSRGIWASNVKHEGSLPPALKYSDAAPSALAKASVRKDAASAWSKEGPNGRFGGHGSLYAPPSALAGLKPSPQRAAPPAARAAPAASPAGQKYSVGGTAVDVYEPAKIEAFPSPQQPIEAAPDDEPPGEAPPLAPAPADDGDAVCDAMAEGERLFARLSRVSTAHVSRNDYYDAKLGWDVEGLQEDLEIEHQAAEEGVALPSELDTFLRAFAFAAPSEAVRREEAWRLWDPNGNGYLSLAEVDLGVKMTLQSFLKDAGAGEAVWRRFRPSFIRAFNDAKDAAAAASSLSDDYVTKGEFRLLLSYLGYYATWFEVFAMVDGCSDGTTATDDRRISREEWEEGIEKVVAAGLSWAPYVALRSATSASFDEMDSNGGGYVLLIEFCAWLKAAEVEAATPAGLALAAGDDATR